MTVKRFENRLNKDNVKFNTLNPVWDNEKEDALNVFEMIDLLNELNDECEFLKIDNEALEDGATKYAELYHKSLKENEQLKQQLRNSIELIRKDTATILELEEEIKELKGDVE